MQNTEVATSRFLTKSSCNAVQSRLPGSRFSTLLYLYYDITLMLCSKHEVFLVQTCHQSLYAQLLDG